MGAAVSVEAATSNRSKRDGNGVLILSSDGGRRSVIRYRESTCGTCGEQRRDVYIEADKIFGDFNGRYLSSGNLSGSLGFDN